MKTPSQRQVTGVASIRGPAVNVAEFAGALCRFGAAAILLCFISTPGFGQNLEVSFDPSGNLTAETLESLGLPQIVGQPQMQVVIPGESASFSVGVADLSGISYQWYFDTSAIPGATSDALLLANVSSSNEGFYWVAVSNAVGSTASTLANLYIDSRGCGMPDSWQLQYFGNLDQNPLDDYDGDGISNLQEFLDGTNPTNATSALYRISLVNDGGTVVVSPDQSTYTNGQVVTLTATGSAATIFHAWTGDVASRSNSITVTMTGNLNLFAHFLPFTLVWTNLASGDWNVASNWSPNLVPASSESVIIGAGFAGGASLPTITENNDVDLVDFTIGNSYWTPTLTGSGRITISGTGIWNAGTISGTGSIVIEPGASFTLTSPGLTLDRTLENAGSMVLSGTSFALGGILTNDPGAQFQLLNPAAINSNGSSSRFDNAGLFITAASAGVTSLNGVPFNNFGTLQIQGGTLVLDGGGTDAGVINVPAGATLNLAGGNFTSSGNPSITGGGNFLVSGASGTLGGLVNLTGSNVFSNGSIDFTGSYILTNAPLPISGCAVSFDGASLVTPTVLTLSRGSLGGSSLVTVSSAMNWSGGSLNGTGRTLILPGATLNITCTSPMFINSRTLEIGGSATWTGTSTISIADGVITNDAGALFNALSPMDLESGGGSPRFDNAGVFRTAPTAGTTSLGVAFNNYNDTQIQGGTLQLGGGGANNGAIEVPAGTTLDLSGGSFNASPASSITGAGNFTVSFAFTTLAGLLNVSGTNTFGNGTAELSGDYICTNNTMIISGATVSFDGTGPVSPAVLNLSGGILGGSNLVTVGNALNWTGGSMAGTGRTIIPSGATLTINNPTFITITSRTLENAGVAVWTGAGSINMNGGLITNDVGAFFNVQTASSISIGGGFPRFDNAGTFRKSVSAGTFTLAAVPFTNYGTVDVQCGVLFANVGGFGSSSNAILNCAIGGTIPATNYGQLQVSGGVNLNGTLRVNLTNNYIPTTNDSFTLITAGSRNGTFSNFIYPSNQVSMELSNTANSVILIVTNIIVTPGLPTLSLQQLSPTLALLFWPTNFSNYHLQTNSSLNSTTWAASAVTPAVSGSSFVVTNSLAGPHAFFRLSNQ